VPNIGHLSLYTYIIGTCVRLEKKKTRRAQEPVAYEEKEEKQALVRIQKSHSDHTGDEQGLFKGMGSLILDHETFVARCSRKGTVLRLKFHGIIPGSLGGERPSYVRVCRCVSDEVSGGMEKFYHVN